MKQNKFLKNIKGYSLSSWVEVGAGIVLLMVCIGIIFASMNEQYSTTYDSSFGIVTNDTYSDLMGIPPVLDEGLKGEASTSSLTGMTLGTLWSMSLAIIKISINIVSGTLIFNAVAMLGWGAAGTVLAAILWILFVVSILLIVIRLLFKINP